VELGSAGTVKKRDHELGTAALKHKKRSRNVDTIEPLKRRGTIKTDFIGRRKISRIKKKENSRKNLWYI